MEKRIGCSSRYSYAEPTILHIHACLCSLCMHYREEVVVVEENEGTEAP